MADPIPLRVASTGDAAAAPGGALPVSLFGAAGTPGPKGDKGDKGDPGSPTTTAQLATLLQSLPGWKAGTDQTLGHAANGAISWIDNPPAG